MSIPLSSLVEALTIVAPLELAEDWDNVGLLIDPRAGADLDIERVLLTIDMTPAVLDEARRIDARCVIAYHPPLFSGVKRLSRREQPLVFEAISREIAVYSPHTALDNARGGLTDWLSEALGPGACEPLLQQLATDASAEFKLVTFVPKENLDGLRDALAEAGAGNIGLYSHCSFSLEGEGSFFGGADSNPRVGSRGKLERVRETRLELVCPKRALPKIAAALRRVHPYEEPAWDLYSLSPKPWPATGTGRRVELFEPAPIAVLVERIKAHLGLPALRLALSPAHESGTLIQSIAVCAGSGGSVFKNVAAELFFTGEMRHHDVLEKLARGSSVVLCEHTHTERGYLPRLRERLVELLSKRVDVRLAKSDQEPLSLV